MSIVACIVLLGPPGSGKGTQAKRLVAKKDSWVHVSTGDLFRAEIGSGSELGNSVKETIAAGNLVKDETTNQVFASQLKRILAEKPQTEVLLLDGYPRTAPQAQALTKLCQEIESLKTPQILEFLADEEMLVERLSGRRINPKTGKIYHLVTNPPQKEGVCDDDGTPLEQRPDDQPDTIRSRYKLYTNERNGIVNALQNGDLGVKVRQLDAGQSPDLVEAKLEQVIAEAIQ